MCTAFLILSLFALWRQKIIKYLENATLFTLHKSTLQQAMPCITHNRNVNALSLVKDNCKLRIANCCELQKEKEKRKIDQKMQHSFSWQWCLNCVQYTLWRCHVSVIPFSQRRQFSLFCLQHFLWSIAFNFYAFLSALTNFLHAKLFAIQMINSSGKWDTNSWQLDGNLSSTNAAA